MGKPDVSLKVWLGNPARFADLFKAILFKGKHIIDASELEIEKSEYDMIVTDKSDSQKTLQSFRDIVMRWNNEFGLVILACENQELINYGMPVRNMIYDGMAYSEQIQQINNSINANVSKHKSIPDIYYSKELNLHKLVPVITLVLYYGNEEWDEPLDLYDMLDIENDNYWDEDVMKILLKTGKRFDEKLEKIKINNKKERNKDGKENYNFMCVFDEIYEDGVEQGIEQGIRNLIEFSYENKLNSDIIKQALIDKFSLSEEVAVSYMEKYFATKIC